MIREIIRNENELKRKDLIFARPAFFYSSSYAQLAHLALSDTQAYASQSQKSQFFATQTETINYI